MTLRKEFLIELADQLLQDHRQKIEVARTGEIFWGYLIEEWHRGFSLYQHEVAEAALAQIGLSFSEESELLSRGSAISVGELCDNPANA